MTVFCKHCEKKSSFLNYRFKTEDSYYGILCHKVILAAASPLLASCILEAGHVEDLSCIILPDFTGQEVEDFLGILYLEKRAAVLESLFNCLVEGGACAPLHHNHQLESSVKSERKVDKATAEIKTEDVEVKMKKKVEEDLSVGNELTGKELGAKIAGLPWCDPEEVASSRTAPPRAKPEPGQYRCATCLKVFRLRRLLRMHEQVHSEPRLACPEAGCNRRFRKRFNLTAHLDVVHRGWKNFPCELCGKRYYNESKLKAHASTHTADKFICQHCPRSGAFPAFPSWQISRSSVGVKNVSEKRSLHYLENCDIFCSFYGC